MLPRTRNQYSPNSRSPGTRTMYEPASGPSVASCTLGGAAGKVTLCAAPPRSITVTVYATMGLELLEHGSGVVDDAPPSVAHDCAMMR